jgi:hypothetical protein
LFVQKQLCLVKYFIEDAANHDLLNAFLRVAKSTNETQRKSFLVALEQLLSVPAAGLDQRQSDIIQMLVSNLMTPAQFPNSFGSVNDSITFLLKIADVPFEEQEMQILGVVQQLLKHQWAFKPFFQNAEGIKYILKRSKIMSIATKKFEINEWVARESGQLNQIDMVVAS